MNFTSASFFLIISLIISASAFGQKATPSAHGGPWQVVINHEEMYLIIPRQSVKQEGWKATGKSGSLAECTRYIEEVWTDMRPLSIRKLNLPANTLYGVVINHEEQYAVWPQKQKLPQGWKATGKKGNLQDCMSYIEEVWTDMRPLSFRR